MRNEFALSAKFFDLIPIDAQLSEHESGHALVVARLGGLVESIRLPPFPVFIQNDLLIEDEPCEVRRKSFLHCQRNNPRMADQVIREMAVNYAGAMAEAEFMGGKVAFCLEGTGREDKMRLMKTMRLFDLESGSAELTMAHHLAERLIKKYKADLRKVANELQKRRFLSGDEFYEILGTHYLESADQSAIKELTKWNYPLYSQRFLRRKN